MMLYIFILSSLFVSSVSYGLYYEEDESKFFLKNKNLFGSEGLLRKSSCIYGGWVSSMSEEEGCVHPYRGNGFYQVCGLAGVHRCNPVIFGESDWKSVAGSNPGKGMCVEAKREDSASMAWACIKAAYGFDGKVDVGRFREHLKSIEGRERYLGEYLLRATEIVEEHCSEQSNDFCARNHFPRCRKLRYSFFGKTSGNPPLVGYGSWNEVLLEEVGYFVSDIQKRSDVYFPLIESSHIWKIIREEKIMTKHFENEHFWPHWCNPYDIFKSNQLRLNRLGYKTCLSRKRLLEDEMINQTPWGQMNLLKRAENIYQLAKESHEDIKIATKGYYEKSGVFENREKVDGNIFHKDANPAVAACFIFHETKGSLHPFRYNYKYCTAQKDSKAYGLGQVTLLTLNDIREVNYGSNLPLITPEAEKFYWPGYVEGPMSGEDIYRHMNFSPKFQTELVLRILNRKAKAANSTYKDKYQLRHLVEAYYGCNKSSQFCQKTVQTYIKNLLSCVKCFGQGHLASSCYRILE